MKTMLCQHIVKRFLLDFLVSQIVRQQVQVSS